MDCIVPNNHFTHKMICNIHVREICLFYFSWKVLRSQARDSNFRSKNMTENKV